MSDALERIATALERLVELEERRDERARRRRRGESPPTSGEEDEPVDELTMRRAAEMLQRAGVGRSRSTPGARGKGRR